jgi:GH24 family phage-related lysozyme (muramidase)
MPRLPDKSALGSVSLRSGRSLISAEDARADVSSGIRGVARGLKSVGQAASAISEDMQREQDSLDLIRADAHYKKSMLDAERSFDNDPDYGSYDLRFAPLAGTITDDSANMIRNPKVREKWAIQKSVETAGTRDRILSKGAALDRQAKLVDIEKSLGTHQSIYADPNTDDVRRAQALSDIDAAIAVGERSGVLDAKQADGLRKTYGTGSKLKRLQTLLDTDPDQVDRALNGTTISRPVLFNEDGSVSTERTITVEQDGKWINIPTIVAGKQRTDEEAVALYRAGKNPSVGEYSTETEASVAAEQRSARLGEQYKNLRPAGDGASPADLETIRQLEGFHERAYPDGRQHSNGYGTKARSPNEVITREEAERRLLAETNQVAKWINKNITVPLTSGQKGALISFGYNLGTDDLEKLKADINAGNFERVAERMLSFDQANLDGKGLKRLPGLTRRRQIEANMFLGRAPDPEYADIDPEIRAKVGKAARQARVTANQSRLWDFKQQLADDVESRRRTGVGREGLEVDAIRRTVEPSVWNNYVNNAREADMEFEAGNGLESMETDRIGTHLENLVPNPGEPDYEMKVKVYEKVKDRADKLRALREKDPAASVGDLPEVKRATAEYEAQSQEGGADIGKLIRTRLDAQARVGIPSYDQSPITRAEGQALLDLPSNVSGLPEREYRGRLKAAADRAEQEYGPLLARPVFEAAVRFHIRDTTGSDAAAGIITKMIRGESVTRDDYRRMTELQNIDMIGRSFDATLRPDMGDDERPYISPNFARDNLNFTTSYAAQEAGKQPSAAQIDWMRQNANDPSAAAEFDLRFGRGAAARALNTPKARN